jgi:hypothetical protein
VKLNSLRRRSRTTPIERAQWVRRFQRSGLTQRAFAQEHRLGLSTLQQWIVRQHQAVGSNGWAKLREVSLETVLGAHPWAAEIVLPDTTLVRVRQMEPVAPLLQALRRSC